METKRYRTERNGTEWNGTDYTTLSMHHAIAYEGVAQPPQHISCTELQPHLTRVTPQVRTISGYAMRHICVNQIAHTAKTHIRAIDTLRNILYRAHASGRAGTTKGKANEQTGASKEMKTNATSDALNAEAKGARETAEGRLNEKLRRETTAMLRMQMQEHSEGVALTPSTHNAAPATAIPNASGASGENYIRVRNAAYMC